MSCRSIEEHLQTHLPQQLIESRSFPPQALGFPLTLANPLNVMGQRTAFALSQKASQHRSPPLPSLPPLS